MTSKVCKLIILGDSGVGKTTLIHSFITQEYRADFKATLGADLSTKSFVVDGQQVEAQLWDTAGTERFRSMGSAYYRGTDACILVYDITSHLSFEHLNSWRKDLIDCADIDNPEMFPFVIFANKSDLDDQRQVNRDEALAWAESKGAPHFEVSAKNGTNIQDGFLKTIQLFLKYGRMSLLSINVGQTLDATPPSNSCC